jgi:hypothetical protein
VQALNRTEAGRASLAQAVTKLKAAVGIANGDPANLNAAIGIARKQDPTLSALFSHIDDNHLGAAALLLSLDDLRRRIARQEPFADDLALAASVTGNDPAVRTALANLLPYAETGIAGRGTLAQQLVDLSAAVVTSEVQGDDGPLKAQAVQRLSQFVKIRRTADVAGKGADASVARAQIDMTSGDVRGALAEMQALQGPAAVSAAPWVMAAKGYVAADESTDILSQTILQVLSAAASGGGFSVESLVGTLKDNFTPPAAANPLDPGAAVPYMSPAMLDHGGSGQKLAPYDPSH